MNKRTQRLSIIRRIIETEPICSQEELLSKLQKQKISITQSTLSRDLKFMHVAKIPHREKGYIYIIPEQIVSTHADRSVSSIITDSITGIDFSLNIGVIHTKAGYANAVAVLLDNKNFPEIIGSIAGDDTIIFVLREDENRQRFVQELKKLCPNATINY